MLLPQAAPLCSIWVFPTPAFCLRTGSPSVPKHNLLQVCQARYLAGSKQKIKILRNTEFRVIPLELFITEARIMVVG